MSSVSDNVLQIFKERYQTTPRLFFSPGRINLIGEHVDYNDGYVMPAAIDKGIWYAVAPNNADVAHFYAADLNEEFTVDFNEIHPVEGWQNYVLGVLDQVQKRELELPGFDCVFGGNLPVGAGMSSSAAVECGLLFALNEIFDYQLQRTTIATMAQKAEHTFPGVKCGIMDMFANMMGKMDHVILLNCLNLEFEHVPLNLSEYSIILINTKVHHSLASSEYNLRRQECAEGFQVLQQQLPDIKTFQDVKPGDVEAHKGLFSEKIYKRLKYVSEEIVRTLKAAGHLKNNELVQFGQLMFQTHEGLSTLYNVSCPELDFLVEQAKKYDCIIGSRLMGGGFGGCTINLIRKQDWITVTREITAAYKKQFNIDAEVYDMATSDGTFEAV